MRERLWAAVLAALALSGCAGRTTTNPPIEVWPDMKRQPKYKAQAESGFFGDGRASRRPVAGTVAIGHLTEDTAFATGQKDGMYIGRNPLPFDSAVLERGRGRYNIYCAPCHDKTGSGHGIVSQRSSWLPSNLQDARIRSMPDGELFTIISHGRRSMPGYRFQITERDRWAIAAYVRALQRAGAGSVEDVPVELRSEIR